MQYHLVPSQKFIIFDASNERFLCFIYNANLITRKSSLFGICELYFIIFAAQKIATIDIHLQSITNLNSSFVELISNEHTIVNH